MIIISNKFEQIILCTEIETSEIHHVLVTLSYIFINIHEIARRRDNSTVIDKISSLYNLYSLHNLHNSFKEVVNYV